MTSNSPTAARPDPGLAAAPELGVRTHLAYH